MLLTQNMRKCQATPISKCIKKDAIAGNQIVWKTIANAFRGRWLALKIAAVRNVLTEWIQRRTSRSRNWRFKEEDGLHSFIISEIC